MRGLVMVLMTIDHSSGAFNAGRLMTDSATSYRPGTLLDEAQFLTRWMTHLCAPTFVFLAGTALSLSVQRRIAAGEPARRIDRFIVTRGLILAALDPLWMSWVMVKPGNVLLQVLYALGISMVCMALLRRLHTRWLVGLGLALVVGGEALTSLVRAIAGGQRTLPAALTLTGGGFPRLFVAYPFVPWLALMVLGFAFGRALRLANARPERWLAAVGVGALGAFALVRGLNGYGNMRLLRDDGSLVQWLHVSKYPPSLTYIALELGIMTLCLAGFFALARRTNAPRFLDPLLVFGQTALFFYVLHIHLLEAGALATGLSERGGLLETYLGALAALLVLYPACAWYRRYKRAHPDGWTQYL
jgi:uncharacterized membrane protein